MPTLLPLHVPGPSPNRSFPRSISPLLRLIGQTAPIPWGDCFTQLCGCIPYHALVQCMEGPILIGDGQCLCFEANRRGWIVCVSSFYKSVDHLPVKDILLFIPSPTPEATNTAAAAAATTATPTPVRLYSSHAFNQLQVSRLNLQSTPKPENIQSQICKNVSQEHHHCPGYRLRRHRCSQWLPLPSRGLRP